jgi:demethylmenaquinone methyltransferase/2-methoxy-6-polyprenyl-1,4-benzoquinol methylase
MQISRVKRTKHAAQVAYNRLSHVYDWLANPSEAKFINLGLEMLRAIPGETILEIGSGTGRAIVELCTQVGDQGSVHGLDLSQGMLKMARSRLSKTQLLTKVNLLAGDGARLPYKSESFSAVFISFTLELFDTPEIPTVLEECLRVLRPDGRLCLIAMMKKEHPGPIVRLYEWFHEHFPTYVDCRPIDVESIIHAAGFQLQNRQVRIMWGLPVEIVLAFNS